MKINSKTIARLASVQILYQYEINDKQVDFSKLLEEIIDYYDNKIQVREDFDLGKYISIKLHINHLRELIGCTVNDLNAIDQLIEGQLIKPWKVTDLNLVLLAILRLGTSELKYFLPTTPNKVVITEFANIASSLLPNSQVGVVNYVLDKISRSLCQ